MQVKYRATGMLANFEIVPLAKFKGPNISQCNYSIVLMLHN